MKKMGKEVELVNVRLPLPIVEWIDLLVKKGIYKSRSEAIRDFVRSYVLSQREASQ